MSIVLSATAINNIQKKKYKPKEYKPIKNIYFLVPITIILTVAGYRSLNSNENKSVNKDINQISTPIENNIRQVGNGFIQYNVTQNDEIKKITELVTRYCNGKEGCEIEQIFKYVADKPYVVGSSEVKTPNQVINTDGGDCDEKTYLFASMLKEKGHKCVIVYVKDHAFAAVEVKDKSYLYSKTASLNIHGKYYFYAETTAKGSYIGWFNQWEPKDFQSVYDVNENKEITLNEVSLNLN